MVDDNIEVVVDNVDTDVVENVETDEIVLDDDTAVETATEEDDLEFNPDELEFEDDELYNIGGYNLSKYKENFDLEDEKTLTTVTNYVEGLLDKGFTQEQVEFLLDREIADTDEEEKPNKPKTAKEIKENLNKSLTAEEKRNYNNVNRFVADMLTGTELEEFRTEIVTNPNLIKLMNIAYKKSLGETKLRTPVTKRSEKQIRSVSFDDAMSQVKQSMTKKGDTKSLVKQLSGSVADKEQFVQMMKVMGLA